MSREISQDQQLLTLAKRLEERDTSFDKAVDAISRIQAESEVLLEVLVSQRSRLIVEEKEDPDLQLWIFESAARLRRRSVALEKA